MTDQKTSVDLLRRFPVLNQQSCRQSERKQMPRSVPWALVERFREQAESNHGQTLERLAERGGLAPEEMWAAAHGHRLFRRIVDEQAAIDWLNAEVCRLESLEAKPVRPAVHATVFSSERVAKQAWIGRVCSAIGLHGLSMADEELFLNTVGRLEMLEEKAAEPADDGAIAVMRVAAIGDLDEYGPGVILTGSMDEVAKVGHVFGKTVTIAVTRRSVDGG